MYRYVYTLGGEKIALVIDSELDTSCFLQSCMKGVDVTAVIPYHVGRVKLSLGIAFATTSTADEIGTPSTLFVPTLSNCLKAATMAVGRSTNAMQNFYKQARSQMPSVISIPPTWLRSYEDFVTKNASQVSQIESALRSLTYIIPGWSPRLPRPVDLISFRNWNHSSIHS